MESINQDDVTYFRDMAKERRKIRLANRKTSISAQSAQSHLTEATMDLIRDEEQEQEQQGLSRNVNVNMNQGSSLDQDQDQDKDLHPNANGLHPTQSPPYNPQEPDDEEDNNNNSPSSTSASTTDPSLSKQTSTQMQVQFTTVQIRDYGITIGDNPCPRDGPPLTIEWNHHHEDEFTLPEYEATRPERRHNQEMIIPSKVRFEILQKSGCTVKDIIRATKEVDMARRERMETTSMLYRSKTHESLERWRRALRNLVTNKKRKERKFLELSKHVCDFDSTCSNSVSSHGSRSAMASTTKGVKGTDSVSVRSIASAIVIGESNHSIGSISATSSLNESRHRIKGLHLDAGRFDQVKSL